MTVCRMSFSERMGNQKKTRNRRRQGLALLKRHTFSWDRKNTERMTTEVLSVIPTPTTDTKKLILKKHPWLASYPARHGYQCSLDAMFES